MNTNKSPMTLTDENVRSIAVQYYSSIGCTGEDEFDKDLDIAKKIMHQLNKLERGDPKANPRLMINYVITLFNVFEFEFARELLYHTVDPETMHMLKALLIETNRATEFWHPEISTDVNTTTLVRKELT